MPPRFTYVSNFDAMKLSHLLHLIKSSVAAVVPEFIAVALKQLAAFGPVVEVVR